MEDAPVRRPLRYCLPLSSGPVVFVPIIIGGVIVHDDNGLPPVRKS